MSRLQHSQGWASRKCNRMELAIKHTLTKIDAQLLQAVHLEVLKPEYVQNADGACFLAGEAQGETTIRNGKCEV